MQTLPRRDCTVYMQVIAFVILSHRRITGTDWSRFSRMRDSPSDQREVWTSIWLGLSVTVARKAVQQQTGAHHDMRQMCSQWLCTCGWHWKFGNWNNFAWYNNNNCANNCKSNKDRFVIAGPALAVAARVLRRNNTEFLDESMRRWHLSIMI